MLYRLEDYSCKAILVFPHSNHWWSCSHYTCYISWNTTPVKKYLFFFIPVIVRLLSLDLLYKLEDYSCKAILVFPHSNHWWSCSHYTCYISWNTTPVKKYLFFFIPVIVKLLSLDLLYKLEDYSCKEFILPLSSHCGFAVII